MGKNERNAIFAFGKPAAKMDEPFKLLLFSDIQADIRSVWPSVDALNRNHSVVGQNQRSEPEAESLVRSTSDNGLHAVSIPDYETHRSKEDSCSPNLDGDLAQCADKI